MRIVIKRPRIGGDYTIHFGEQGLLDEWEHSLSLPLPKAGWEF